MTYIITNPARELEMPSKINIKGRYKLMATRPDGSVRSETPWFENLILDDGLNNLSSVILTSKCWVGTGSVTPAVTDTGLSAPLTSTTTGVTPNPEYGNSGEPNYYQWRRFGFRFNPGPAAGNLTEIGISSNSNVFLSRSLIKDQFGQPTTFQVLPDETLDVVYELQVYKNLLDTTYTASISGNTHEFISRASDINYNHPSRLGHYLTFSDIYVDLTKAWSGNIGNITETPAGSYMRPQSLLVNAYANNSLQRSAQCTWGLDYGNFVGGIKAFSVTSHDQGGWFDTQINVNPPIMKLNTQVLVVNFEVSWSRRP